MLVDAGGEPAGEDAGRELPERPDGPEELGGARLVADVPLHLLDTAELPDRHQSSSRRKLWRRTAASPQSLGRTVPFFIRYRVRGEATQTGWPSRSTRTDR